MGTPKSECFLGERKHSEALSFEKTKNDKRSYVLTRWWVVLLLEGLPKEKRSINHGVAVYVIRRKTECNHFVEMYVIDTKDCVYTFGDAIRLRQLHTR